MPSRRSSARQPAAARPEFLVNRSLGRLELVKTLRSAGLIVHTLADVYGEEVAQQTQDTSTQETTMMSKTFREAVSSEFPKHPCGPLAWSLDSRLLRQLDGTAGRRWPPRRGPAAATA